MKYAIIIPSGAVDEPLDALAGRTPLEAAKLPTLDGLARVGRLGTALTVRPGRPVVQEKCLVSVLGYDPEQYPVARGPLEARARGLQPGPDDQVFRCNLVTVIDEHMRDFSAGCISSAEAGPIIDSLNAGLAGDRLRIHAGRAYRHLLVWKGAGPLAKLRTTPPQEIPDQPIKKHLPRGRDAKPLTDLIQRCRRILRDHDVNAVRSDLGENPATMVWPWGPGRPADLPAFQERFGVRAAFVAGADLTRGLASLLGCELRETDDASGLLDTDYAAKGRAAVAALDEFDLVCVQVEAPDEAAHLGLADQKVRALEQIDGEIVAPLLERLRQERQWRVLVMPEQATSSARRTHTFQPTVFVMAGSGIESNRGETFDEANASVGELHLERAHDLMDYFLHR